MSTKLQMKDISIEFPGVKALSNVDFSMETGTIHALIGANGAGKSTLMKVLAGAHDHYTGSIHMNDSEVNIQTPKDAKELGIDIVYQEVDMALIPYLDVGENIMLDILVNKMGKKQRVNWKEVHRRANDVLKRMNVQLSTKTKVMDLTLAEKQMVLIARAIVEDRKFLILDEPTAPLSQRETDELFRIVRDLAQNHQVGIIFISHRLPELFKICEEITIMKDGKIVKHSAINDITQRQVVEAMLGKSFNEEKFKQEIPVGDVMFSVKDVSEKDKKVKNINLEVRSGEIVGVAGLVGAGKTELCKTLFGALEIESGSIVLKEKSIKPKTPFHAVQQGIALVPEERRKEGVLVEEPVYSNLTAANLKKFTRGSLFLNPKKEREAARKMIQDIGVKTPHENQKVALLSGGNQQKVAVGKWLMTDAELLMFDEPTKGVDVGAKGDIFELISSLAKQGKGILYASSELQEIMSLTDRVYVMYDGEIVKELVTSETTEEEILYFSTGGK